jgi:cellobiose phosphorylase
VNAINGSTEIVPPAEHLYRPVDVSKMGSEEIPSGESLQLFNGYGGFTPNGREYVIQLRMDPQTKRLRYPPAPWINVISNPHFGFLTSEKGSGYTWSRNSRENKLTPWSNDAVLDPSGEAIYIRDEEQQYFWSPLPEPVSASSFYEVRHGFGYSTYQSKTLNIEQTVSKWVAADEPIKIVKLHLSNTDLMSKRLSIFSYVDWVLGVFREDATRHITTSLDSKLQTIFASNNYNNEFAGRVAAAAIYTPGDFELDAFTSDRSAFIGRNNTLRKPQALGDEFQLDGRFGMGWEVCAASQLTINLASGSSADVYILLAETEDESAARELIRKYRDESVIKDSLQKVKAFWQNKLSRIQIQTPTPEFNFLVNGWLQYQNIACRMWGRTGFYQAGGAFGFRDQLQDSTAACYVDPSLTRQQILLHAAHQFKEGDVLHWWHPPTDRGIRSRITDDLLWLPYVSAFYIRHTGDHAILDEEQPFVAARSLQENEHEAYLHPETTTQVADLYEHCCRAIDRSLTKGAHGLPLIGSGDWNDGMNMVGADGKGESVWLGFFLYDILQSFIPLCKQRNDHSRVETYRTYKQELKKHLNNEGWDGNWYRRAYYDDGTPLGSHQNNECRIDAIAQAWSVIAGVAPDSKARKALASARELLVSEEEKLIRLLTPAFDKTSQNPGYIKGYIPGVRENGGQYTHAALWLVKAFATFGERSYAARLMRMLTPITHAISEEEVHNYHVEPYAVAADVYGEDPLTGMGGWTWYTGSAGWMYRVMIESILGIEIRGGNQLLLKPLVLPEWKSYRITVRSLDGNTSYRIDISNHQKIADGEWEAMLDGEKVDVDNGRLTVTMMNDQEEHDIQLAITEKNK